MPVKLRSIIQCPHCGFKVTEKMPADTPLQLYACPACHKSTGPKPGDCCVFCSYGSIPCPAAQRRQEGLS